MHNRNSRAGADLHHAADIAGADHVGLDRLQCCDLSLLQFVGDLGLHQVVGSGGATADVAVSRLHDCEARRLEQILWRAADLLPVLKGTRGVIGDAQRRGVVGIFAKALATPFEVSGAAYHEGTAWLRLEGLEQQVAYRRGRLQALFGSEEIEILSGEASRGCWRSLRDVEHFAGVDTPLWRVLVKPTEAPATIAALERLGGRTSIDWGGGLIWYCGPAEGSPVRAVLPAGHATLLRRGSLPAGDLFQPATRAVAALSASLRRTFDPIGILNPGLMGA